MNMLRTVAFTTDETQAIAIGIPIFKRLDKLEIILKEGTESHFSVTYCSFRFYFSLLKSFEVYGTCIA